MYCLLYIKGLEITTYAIFFQILLAEMTDWQQLAKKGNCVWITKLRIYVENDSYFKWLMTASFINTPGPDTGRGSQ